MTCISVQGPSWSWSYGSGIYNYLCNQCLLPPVVRCTRYNIIWLVTGRWFSTDSPVSSTNKTDCHDITEILLKVALSTINHNSHISVPTVWSFVFAYQYLACNFYVVQILQWYCVLGLSWSVCRHNGFYGMTFVLDDHSKIWYWFIALLIS